MTNNPKGSIGDTLTLVLRDEDLRGVAIDNTEVIMDTFLDDDVLKDVPVLGTLVKLISASSTIADKLLLRKLMVFLFNLKDVPAEDRAKVIGQIDESEEYRMRVGEKLLYIVDSCEDHEIAELVSRVFKYFLQGKITYRQFLKAASILQKLNITDFKWLVREKGHRYFDLSNTGDLMHTGLFELYYHDVSVDIREKYHIVPREHLRPSGVLEERIPYEAEVDGGIDVSLSEAGEIIMEIFNPKFERRKHTRRLKTKLL